MMRVMRMASVVLLMPMVATAQNPTRPTCVEVAKDIDKYADQEVTFPGRINSAEVRDGVMVMIFACATERGDVIPGAYFGVTLAQGADSIPRITNEMAARPIWVTGVVRASDAWRIFRNPPAFRGPYLYRVTIKPGNGSGDYTFPAAIAAINRKIAVSSAAIQSILLSQSSFLWFIVDLSAGSEVLPAASRLGKDRREIWR